MNKKKKDKDVIIKNWNLVQAIVEKKLTQRDFARLIQVHESVVSGVVNNRINLTGDQMEQWSKALGKHVSQLWPHKMILMEARA